MTSPPTMMTAVVIDGKGGPEVLVPREVPVPAPGAGQILVKVAAAGVNRPDVQQRLGAYPPPKGHSPLPGLEIAGEVVAVGPGTARWRAGDKVCALVNGGGYAQFCIAEETAALPIPQGLGMIEAAALPETHFTVWNNVFERGALKAGEWFMVHGGTSGIGTTAIQLAVAFGARVFATAGSDDKCVLCVDLGAERAVNYRTEKFLDALQAHTAKQGVDVILDMVGGPYLADNLKLLRPDGRLVYIAALGGNKGELNVGQVFLKRLTITGSTLRNRPVAEKGRIARALEQHVWPLLLQRTVVPVIQQVLPLEAAVQAHRLLEANEALGKLVLTPAGDP